jgi:hypothetical protein
MKKTTGIIKKYLKKYPQKTSTQLSQLIYKENDNLFKDSESIRTIIRYYRGKLGKNKTKSLDFIQKHEDVVKKIPNVLLFDVETSPIISYVWGAHKQYINYQQIIRPWHLISWAARWLYETDVHSDVLTVNEALKGDDKRITKSLWKMFNDADIIIAHNCKKFDDKRAKTRFILNGLNPPSPYQIIDTYEQSYKEFAFTSNKLDYLGNIFNDYGKIDTDFDLWAKSINFDRKYSKEEQKKALQYMLKYNIQDVFVLEEYYLMIRPWIKNHPNMGIYQESVQPVCYKCGSPNIEPEGIYVTPLNKYYTMRCKDCGAIAGRERISGMTVKQKKSLISPVTR